jgi:hypothetical protein
MPAVSGRDLNVDFRRIQRRVSGLRRLSDWLVHLSGFEGGDEIDISGTCLTQLHRPCDDDLEAVMKLFGLFDQEKSCEIER